MFKLLGSVLAALLCLNGCSLIRGDKRSWAAYYDTQLPAKAFKNMGLVVFDRRHYPAFDVLKGKTIVLAYISIGEVYDDVPESKTLEKKKLLLSHNKIWNSHVVDVTSPVWQAMVLAYVDDAAVKGFDGVMLDTIDSPLYWAEKNAPKKLNAMQAHAATLIHAIHKAHPSMKIMLNRGFSLLPLVAYEIDYVLAESIMINTDLSTRQFTPFSPNTYNEAVAQLQHAVALAPHLRVFTLDYWNQDDGKGLEHIYTTQHAQGFIPYVTTPDLQRFTPAPPRWRLW